MWSDQLLFLGRLLRNPRSVGAVAPSSQWLAREMVRGIDFASGPHIVELGVGTGVFTREIAKRLAHHGWFMGVEIDPKFAARVRAELPAFDCACASAEALPALLAERGVHAVDHVLSGLPFASLPGGVTTGILHALGGSIKPGGTFVTFQYLHGYRLPLAAAFRRQADAALGRTMTRTFVARNLPPAYVLRWTRSA